MSINLKISLTFAVVFLSICADRTFAQSENSGLTEAERYVVKQVAAGEIADLEDEFKENEKDRVIRPSFLEDLLINSNNKFQIHRNGIQINGARISDPVNDTVNLANTEIAYFIDLSKCHFDNVYFFQTVFKKGLTIDDTIFDGKADFGYATVMQGLSADRARFMNEKESADFAKIKVTGPVFFDGATFAGSVSFAYAVIDGTLDIREATFNSKDQEVLFNSMKIDRGFFSERAKFSGPVDFRSANVGDNLELDGAYFQNPNSPPQFQDMKVGEVSLDATSFSIPPVLSNLTYQNIYPTSGLLHLIRNSSSDYNAYTQLESCLQKNGYASEADDVFMERKRYERRQGMRWYDYPKSYLSEGLQGFGRKPHRVLYYDFGVILLGAFIFRRRKMVLKAAGSNDNQGATPKSSERPPPYNSFLYSLTLFAPTIDTQYTNNWEPGPEHQKTRRYMRLQKFLGYLIVPLTIAIWTGVFK